MRNYKNTFVSPDANLRDVANVISKSGFRIAMVVADTGQLLGIVTDSDLRKGMAKGLDFTVSVRRVMVTNPLTSQLGTHYSDLIAMMKRNNVYEIPLLDDLGRVCGLETMQTVEEEQSKLLANVFIMAGGYGKRLRPLTLKTPKPMLKIGHQPIIERMICSLVAQGFERLIISVHYKHEVLMDYLGDGSAFGANILWLKEAKPLGTAGSLGLLPDHLRKKPLFVCNADIDSDAQFKHMLQFHIENDADLTVASKKYEHQIPYGVIEHDGFNIAGIQEKPTLWQYVNAGLSILSPKILRLIGDLSHCDMPDLIRRYIQLNKRVVMYPLHEYWIDVGRHEDLNKANARQSSREHADVI